jgi:Tol biopolymer transport system component
VMTTSGKRVGTVNMGGHLADSVSWSPDSSQIVFADRPYAGGVGHVYVASLTGSAPRLLVQGSDPAWSPDGTQIAVRRGCGIWVTDIDGTRSRQVADVAATSVQALERYPAANCQVNKQVGYPPDELGIPQMQPVWSPDGRFLAVQLDEDGVLIIGRNGLDPRIVAPFGVGGPPLGGWGWGPPTWQPRAR